MGGQINCVGFCMVFEKKKKSKTKHTLANFYAFVSRFRNEVSFEHVNLKMNRPES